MLICKVSIVIAYKMIETSVRNNRYDVTKYVFESVYFNQYEVNNLLIVSIIYGSISIAQYLIEVGNVDVNFDNGKALIAAVDLHNIDMVKYLVEKGGADIHASDDNAFVRAIIDSNLDIARYLVEHGSIANAQDGYALIHAAQYLDMESLRYLLEEMDVDFSVYLNTALKTVVNIYVDIQLEVVEYLIASGADKRILENH